MKTIQTTRLSEIIKLIRPLQILFWLGIFLITYFFMRGADRFLELTPRALGKYFELRWVLIAHITAGGGALILGPIQFWNQVRIYSKKLHRLLGLLYLLAILVSSFCAIILAFTTSYEVNWPYAFSAQVWVSVWIISTIIAYRSAISGKFTLHKEWMTRSYIVTVAFVVSGSLLKILLAIEFGSFEEISPSLFWFGWSVPLFIYQVILSLKSTR